MNEEGEQETYFNNDVVKEVILQSMKATLSNVNFNAEKVDQWTATIIEQVLKGLQKLKLFKFVVTSVIMQRTGAGLHSSFSAYWDDRTDSFCTEKWENDTIICVTTVYGVGI